MTGVWIATLDRFGYELRCVGRTELEARAALDAEYRRAYQKRNGFERVVDMETDEEYQDLHAIALEETDCRKLDFGNVEWR